MLDFFSNQEIFKKLHQKEWVFKSLILIKINVSSQIIQYKVTPLFGITLSWMTLITQVKENSYFIDEQKFGHLQFLAPQAFL
jgi:hypothetical protein